MKRIFAYALAILVMASCAGKGGNATEGNVLTNVGKFAYTLDKDVAMDVFKLLGNNVVAHKASSSLPDEEIEKRVKNETSSERTSDMYDYMVNDSLIEDTDGSILGYSIQCLKRKDGKYNVLHSCLVTYDVTELWRKDFYVYDGKTLEPSESFLLQISPDMVCDELDMWTSGIMMLNEDNSPTNPESYTFEVRRNADNTRDVLVKVAGLLGGRWFSWNGENLSHKDEAVERPYYVTMGFPFIGFNYGEPLPDMPKMEHYWLKYEDDNETVTLMQEDDEPLVSFLYHENELVECVLLTDDFGEKAGTVLRDDSGDEGNY